MKRYILVIIIIAVTILLLQLCTTSPANSKQPDVIQGYPVTRSATIVIAPYDATARSKAQADIILEGDPITDVQAIMAAMDEASLVKGTVLVLEGTILVRASADTELHGRNNVRFFGSNTTLRAVEGNTAIMMFGNLFGESVENFEMAGFNFTAPGIWTNGIGILVNGNSVLRNLNFHDLNFYDIGLDGRECGGKAFTIQAHEATGGYAEDIIFDRWNAYNMSISALTIGALFDYEWVKDVEISHFNISGVDMYNGLYFGAVKGKGIHVSDGTIEDTQGSAIVVSMDDVHLSNITARGSGTGDGLEVNQGRNSSAVQVNLYNNARYGLNVHGAESRLVEGWKYIGGVIEGNANHAIWYQLADGGLIMGNTVNAAEGYYWIRTDRTSRSLATNNITNTASKNVDAGIILEGNIEP